MILFCCIHDVIPALAKQGSIDCSDVGGVYGAPHRVVYLLTIIDIDLYCRIVNLLTSQISNLQYANLGFVNCSWSLFSVIIL